ncbi:hypothetical protein [Mycolicibacterium mengxianglii]|uniref:hypothetical protein n=1 Tax=Mycolicibacterium mengxianglii TaxID=2736649 RepID=UPI0018D145AD|nr:hypothetical protein [Mycolicibacterium mengxianglii]
MTVTAIQGNEMWARHFGGAHSVSTTVQLPSVGAFCEIALTSTWTAGESHHASDAFITQIVSANGVEEFPKENVTGGDLVTAVFRQRVTSVTFKVSVYQTKGHARWMIFHWA